MTKLAGKALSTAASVLVLLFCCGAQSSARKPNPLTELSRSLQRVIAKVSPTTVTLEVVAYVPPGDENRGLASTQHGRQRLTKARFIGSGVIVDSHGYIITNAHVVEGAKLLRVTLNETLRATHARTVGEFTSTTFDGHIVGVFKEADLALVKIQATGLPAMQFANSDAIEPGQLVFAVGSPEGYGSSVSMGIVSAVGRDSGTGEGTTFIQTDAAISPGSSGGALVNANGDLVGITSFVIMGNGGNEGLGFALPSNLVRSIFEELKTAGRVNYGGMGISVQNMTPTLALGLHISREWGIIVSDVAPDSPAEKAGVQIQDLIVAIDGQTLANPPQFFASLYSKRVGSQARLEVVRGSQSVVLTVSVAQRIPEPQELPDAPSLERGLVAKLGIVCTPVNQRATSSAMLRSNSGLIVITKLEGAEISSDLISGDVIRSLNGMPITSIEDLRSELDKVALGTGVVLQVERERQFRYMSFEVD
jgi:serine protease Do